jgi:hypothetical protein
MHVYTSEGYTERVVLTTGSGIFPCSCKKRSKKFNECLRLVEKACEVAGTEISEKSGLGPRNIGWRILEHRV